MAGLQGVVLIANTNTGAATSAVNWVGGRTALVLIASAFPTTCQLQYLGPNASTWITINGTTYSANQVTTYDLPAGQYRMNLTGGTTTALYASLCSVPYV